MKTRLLIIFFVLGFTYTSFSINDVFGWCPQNEDWPDRPCYATYQDFGIEKERKDWEPYYNFKGSEWMDSKKQEMTLAIQNDTLSDWIELTSETQAHQNVYEYYFIFGEAPNPDGEFVEEPEEKNILCERIADGICITSNDDLPLPIIAGLEQDTGIVTLENQTYYFETPNYDETAYVDQIQISFYDVIFTLFPSGTGRGGLPTNGCGGMYLWTDVMFSDNTNELLRIFVDAEPCIPDSIPTMLSNHTNPQAVLMFYDEKMKLLVSTDITNSTLQSEQDIEVNYVDFRDASGEIICKGYSSGGGFFEYAECGPNDQFVIHVLIIVLLVAGIVVGFIIWRKRK